MPCSALPADATHTFQYSFIVYTKAGLEPGPGPEPWSEPGPGHELDRDKAKIRAGVLVGTKTRIWRQVYLGVAKYQEARVDQSG